MSLTILYTNAEQLACTAVRQIARRGVEHGSAVVLVPTFAEALQVQKDLAYEGLSLGATVTTPRSYMRSLWDLWGDGRKIVDAPTRTLLMTEQRGYSPLLEVIATPGTVQLLCDLAERGLPWVRDALRTDHGLTPRELTMVSQLGGYEQLLAQKGLVEGATCACVLPSALDEAGVAIPPIVLAGFDELSIADRTFVLGLARSTEVTLVVRNCNPLASQEAHRTAELLAEQAKAGGLEVTRKNGEPCEEKSEDQARAPELNDVLHHLFLAEEVPVVATGAVRLLEPSGPLAEAELVAREVAALASGTSSARTIAIVVPDVRRAWRELAPKLVARGMGVKAQLKVPVLSSEAGRAFMGYARTVAQLVELAKRWPVPAEGPDGPYVRLGSMDWWPPQDLVDFLLSDVSHVGQQKAHALDVAWRGNRLLSPQDVLDQLLSAKATSDAVERATRELLRGRLGSAASKLLAPYVAQGAADPESGSSVTVSMAREEAMGALAAVLSAAGTLKDVGITADPSAPEAVDLATLVQKAELVLRSSRIALRPEVMPQNRHADVLLVGRPEAAALAPASFDAVVLCGLTSQELPVPSGDDELSGMLEALGIEPQREALFVQRAHFWRLCALARTHLLLERARFSADSHETYPAVMLSELTSCYVGKLPASALPEDDARANLSANGASPVSVATEEVSLAGHVHESLRRLVTVPQEGKEELPGGLPVLSASQLESYVECPLKWFSLRRLRLGDNDAGFGPLEMGTFAHRVLELTYAQLYDVGISRLDARDAEAMRRAHEVLDQKFTLHLQHQHMRSGSHPAFQALVAHNSWQESSIDRLRRDLQSSLDYSAQRFLGYEPCAFEWEFGRGDHTSAQVGLPALPHATYAGVQVTGTVDRIDVNAQGQALVIDYKHKGPVGFFAEYAAFRKDAKSDEFVLSRRIQALLYAQVVRRAFPNLCVVGALYLSTRGTHDLSGAVDESQADAAFGGMLSQRRANRVTVQHFMDFGIEGERGMNALLDATEQAIAQKIQRLREGHIEADPVDAAACSFCPVTNCERRITA